MSLHVRPHERAVRVVVFEEGDETCGNADHLVRRDVDIVDHVGGNEFVFAVAAGENLSGSVGFKLAEGLFVVPLSSRRIGGDESLIHFVVGAQPYDVFRDDAIFNRTIRGGQEAEFVDASVEGEVGDQTDVLTFRGLDRADTSVVRSVNVANFEAGAFAV